MNKRENGTELEQGRCFESSIVHHENPAFSAQNALEERTSAGPEGWLYFVQAAQGGPVKIGFSQDPEVRFRTLQVGSAVELRLLAMGDYPEHRYHKAMVQARAALALVKP